MKKLVMLSAVAALAAFGWADVANAGQIGDPNPTCFVDQNGPGFDADAVAVAWNDLAATDAYGVSAVCMDPETGRAKSTKVEVEDNPGNCPAATCFATILLPEFNGFSSMRAGDVRAVTVKALHFPGPNKDHVVGKAMCDSELMD